jgi:hypothetical protein
MATAKASATTSQPEIRLAADGPKEVSEGIWGGQSGRQRMSPNLLEEEIVVGEERPVQRSYVQCASHDENQSEECGLPPSWSEEAW